MVKLFGVALMAAVPSSVFAYGVNLTGVISLDSVRPHNMCGYGCDFDCAAGYEAKQIGDNLTLASTYTGTECRCYAGTGTVSWLGVVTGSFPTDDFGGEILFTAHATYVDYTNGSKIAVMTTMNGESCSGTYSVLSGTVLGVSGAGAASVAVGALAFAAAVVLM